MSTASPEQRPTLAATWSSWVPTLKTQRLVALILLLCQGGITVSGSVVRVTGSGLGCVTWPQCHPGSLVPVAGAAPLLHQVIEFGNRLLTFVVAAAAIAAVVVVYRAQRRKELKVYAWISLGGVVLQALIGAVSVVLQLRWWAVALHFLPSMILVWVAALLWARIREDDHAEAQRLMPQYVRTLATVAAGALAVVLVSGTMVTGSGPHAGDADAGMEGRLELDTITLAISHAVSMYIYLALTLIVIFLLYRHRVPSELRRTGWILVAMIVIQWAVGVTQFYLGVPRWTVPVHIGLSSVVTAATAVFYAYGYRRPLLGAPAA